MKYVLIFLLFSLALVGCSTRNPYQEIVEIKRNLTINNVLNKFGPYKYSLDFLRGDEEIRYETRAIKYRESITSYDHFFEFYYIDRELIGVSEIKEEDANTPILDECINIFIEYRECLQKHFIELDRKYSNKFLHISEPLYIESEASKRANEVGPAIFLMAPFYIVEGISKRHIINDFNVNLRDNWTKFDERMKESACNNTLYNDGSQLITSTSKPFSKPFITIVVDEKNTVVLIRHCNDSECSKMSHYSY